MGIFVDTCSLRFLQEHLFARFGVGLLYVNSPNKGLRHHYDGGGRITERYGRKGLPAGSFCAHLPRVTV